MVSDSTTQASSPAERCLKRAQQVLEDSAQARVAIEAVTTLTAAYVTGKGWTAAGRAERGGSGNLSLRPVIRPETSVVRVAMDIAGPAYRRITARILTPVLDYRVEPRTGDNDDQLSSQVGAALLDDFTSRPCTLRAWRNAQRWASQVGFGYVHRVLEPRKGVRASDAAGKPVLGPDKRPVVMREFLHRWNTVAPYEVCRDPSANSTEFEGEDCVLIERPVTVAEVRRMFPGVPIPETKISMGDMLGVQMALNRLTRGAAGVAVADSKAPGVCMVMGWFRDPDADSDNDWPWMMLAFRDSGGANPEDRTLKPLWFGDNPNWGIGLHQVVYDTLPGSGNGQGCVASMIDVQNAVNLSFSDLIRVCLIHTGNRYVVRKDSIKEDEARLLSKDLSVVIHVDDWADVPRRLEPPTLDPNTAAVLSQGPTWMDAVTGSAGIFRGESGKRETSGALGRLKVQQAEAPLDAIAVDMELVLNELLSGTLADMHRTSMAHTLVERTRGRFTLEQVAAFLKQDLTNSLSGVKVTKDTLRPQSAQEVREVTMGFVDRQVLSAADARWAILRKSGEAVLPGEDDAAWKQEQELQLILAGKPVRVGEQQNHAIHLRVTGGFQDSAVWDTLSPEVQEAVNDHAWQHRSLMEQQAAGMQRAGQGRQANPQDAAYLAGGMAEPNQLPNEAPSLDGAGNYGLSAMGGQPPMPATSGAVPAMA